MRAGQIGREHFTLAIAELSAHQRAWRVLDEFNRFPSLRNP